MSFSKEEIAAADEAFREHREGKCGEDCGFCFDLQLAAEPKYELELNRIRELKRRRPAKQKPLPLPLPGRVKGKGKGKGAGLAGRIKKGQ